MKFFTVFLFCFLCSCTSYKKINFTKPTNNAITGSAFYKNAAAYNWQQRDSVAVKEILTGNVPSFLKKFVPIHVSIKDSVTHKTTKATYYVSPDYISIGTFYD